MTIIFSDDGLSNNLRRRGKERRVNFRTSLTTWPGAKKEPVSLKRDSTVC